MNCISEIASRGPILLMPHAVQVDVLAQSSINGACGYGHVLCQKY